MMPGMGPTGKVVADILKVTGAKRRITKTATTMTAPLALLALTMLPSIAQALSMISSAASLGLIAFMGYKILKAKGIMGSEAVPEIRSSRRSITPEELEARKARAYSFGNDDEAGIQQKPHAGIVR
jgi:hypothetical protein